MVLTVLGIALESVELNCIAALVVAGLMLVASSVMLRPLIEKQNQRPLHFQTSLGFSIGGASLYFYTGSAEKYHAGPHFSMEVTRPFSVWSSQNGVFSVLSVCDVIVLSMLNVKWGIPALPQPPRT